MSALPSIWVSGLPVLLGEFPWDKQPYLTFRETELQRGKGICHCPGYNTSVSNCLGGCHRARITMVATEAH